MLRIEFATPDALAEFVEHKRSTDDPGYEADYEGLKSFLDEHGYNMQIADKALANCKALFQSTQELLPYFAARHWYVKFAAPDAPDFITSDSPIQAFAESPDAYLPGARASDPWVSFALPLTRRAVLIGRYERLGDAALPFTRSAVHFINGCVVDSADRYIYAQNADFEWASASGEVCDHRHAIAAIRTRA